EPPWVAEAVGPDRPELAGLPVERVVGGDRSVLVDPENLAVRTVQVLGVSTIAVVADREIELSVRPECDSPTDMQQRRRRLGLEKREWTVGADILGGTEPYQMVYQVVAGVIKVHVMVADPEIRVKGNTDEPAVAGGLGRQVGEGLRQQLAVLDNLD